MASRASFDSFSADDFRRAAAGEEPIRGEVISANRGLAVRAGEAWARRNPEIDIHDLVQAGFVGLIRAVDKFDPDLGFKFSTYAMHWINKEIRLEVAHEIACGRATKTEAQLFMSGRLDGDRRSAYRSATGPHQCIYEPCGDGMSPLAEMIVDDGDQGLELAEARANLEAIMDAAIERCTHEQFTALMMRYGIVFYSPSSYDSISAELGLGSAGQAKALVEEAEAIVRVALGEDG